MSFINIPVSSILAPDIFHNSFNIINKVNGIAQLILNNNCEPDITECYESHSKLQANVKTRGKNSM